MAIVSLSPSPSLPALSLPTVRPSSSDPIAHASDTMPSVAVVVLQPVGDLSQDHASIVQTMLTAALHQANAVVLDLIWVDAIAPDGMAVLIGGLQLAKSLGKDLSFYSADAKTYAVLQAQRYHQRSSLDQDTAACHADFSEFLSRHGQSPFNSAEKAPLPQPKPFVKPSRPSLPVVLSAAPYAPTNWHAGHVAS